jgi:hypothetical protein
VSDAAAVRDAVVTVQKADTVAIALFSGTHPSPRDPQP